MATTETKKSDTSEWARSRSGATGSNLPALTPKSGEADSGTTEASDTKSDTTRSGAAPDAGPTVGPATGETASSRRALPGRLVYITCIGVAAIWLLLDQATKVLAVVGLPADGTVGVDLGVIDLRLVRNPGGAFGIPGFPGVFIIVTVLVLILVARALPHTDRLSLAAAYGLVTGGALGNVTDRLLRDPGFPSGQVIDFLDLGWWPVFNLADVGIVVGALLIAVLLTVVDREERAAQAERSTHRSVRPESPASST